MPATNAAPAFALGDSHISKCPVKSMGCRHGPKHIQTAPLVRWVAGVQAETCIFPMLANSCSGPDITCAHTLAPSQGQACVHQHTISIPMLHRAEAAPTLRRS